MRCPNCNTKHGCSCQARKASDGKGCCSICLRGYELSIGNNQPAPKKATSADAPTNVQVFYKGPGVQMPPDAL